MKRLREKFSVKITAWIVSFVSLVLCIASVFGAVLMLENGFYTRTEEDVQSVFERYAADSVQGRIYNILLTYCDNEDDMETFENRIQPMVYNVNWRYTLVNKEGEIISGNYMGEDASDHTFDATIYNGENTTVTQLDLSIYVLKNKEFSDIFSILRTLVHIAYSVRTWIYLIAFVCFVLFTLSVVFLLYSAGHKDGKISLGLSGKIYNDIFILLVALVGILNPVVMEISDNITSVFFIFVIPFLAFLDYIVLSLWLKSLVIHIKKKTIFKHTLIYKLISGFVKLIGKTPGIIYTLIISLIPCIVLLIALLIIVDNYLWEVLMLIWFICTVIFVGVSVIHTIKLKKLCDVAESIAKGDFSKTVNTYSLYGEMRNLGENLNSIKDGVQIAVNDKIKSERFKTELITNVSHDLKTPLTSIINYTDILSKLELSNEDAREYISVLSRQSTRLKKLTEDLLEASKASTGNIKLELTLCNIETLLNQTLGEFSEKLEQNSLTPIVNIKSDTNSVWADGRYLYRVFENLMSNICKYSLENTRVYINVDSTENHIIITFKNISKDMLVISSDELLERFVRGDSSRNTEGSGLGLSIAKSLTELQKGRFDLAINGDLFEVKLTFEKIK